MKFNDIQNQEDYNQFVNQKAVIVDFYKDNCPGCKMLDASLSKLTEAPFDEFIVGKAKLEILGEDFFKGLNLRQTPTLIAYRDGQEIGRLFGFAPPAKIKEWLQQNQMLS